MTKLKTLLFPATILISILVGGCVHSRQEKLESALNAWNGQDVDQLVRSWGAPTSTYTFKDGRKVLSFKHDRIATRSLYYYYPESYTDSYLCKINFYTDPSGSIIQAHNYIGDYYTCIEIIPRLPPPAIP